MTKRLSVLALFGLFLSAPLAAQDAAATQTASLLGVGSEGLCSSCHATNSEATVKRWSTATQRVTACLQETEDQAKLDCIAQSDASSTFAPGASLLGVYTTGVTLEPLRSLILRNYGETRGTTILNALNSRVTMPKGTTRRLTQAQFDAALTWFGQGTPGLASFLNPSTGTAQCTDNYTADLASHIKSQNLEGWRAHNESQGLSMFACTSGSCFTQQRQGLDVFPDTNTVDGLENVKFDPNSSLRVLTQLTGRVQYWIRSSPDGRFVGFGGEPSGMIDLQGKLAPTPSTRTISIDAMYDPGFFPDSSAFIFQGDTTGICNLSLLKNALTTSIDFSEDQCTNLRSTRIPLYQSVGASVDGGDYFALTSSYQRDSGLSSMFSEHMPGEELAASDSNAIQLYPLEFDGQTWVRRAAQSFRTPNEIDWVLSHSSQIAVSRLQGKQDNIVQTLGFNIHKFTKNASTGRFEKTQIAQLCGDGLKGDFSFDDRFFVNYSYIRPDHWKHLGYSSANDAGFRAKLQRGSADIFLYDLYTKKRYTITNVEPNQYALYPHFRSDGWLYFEIYDANTGKRHVVASDVAVNAADETPVQ